MSDIVSVDDLRLVAAVARLGSLGAAARELRLAQPSASQRLARLERRCGVVLFTRDRRGARATPAGEEMARRADTLLGHLEGLVPAVVAARSGRPLRVATFPSLASTLFPVLDDLLPELAVEQYVDHGPLSVQRVGEGSQDAAFVAIVGQMAPPRGTTAHDVGRDRLVCLLPSGVAAPLGTRQPFRGSGVPYMTYDLGGQDVHARLAALGATPRRGATADTVIAMARRRSQPAVVPRSATRAGLRDGERVVDLPFTQRFTVSVVTTLAVDHRLVRAIPAIRSSLSLDG